MSRSPKVLHVLNGFHAAGIENFALQLISHAPSDSVNYVANIDASARDFYPPFGSLLANASIRRIYSLHSFPLLLFLDSIVLSLCLRPNSIIIYPCNSRLLWLALGFRLTRSCSISVCIQNTCPSAKSGASKWQMILRLFNLLNVILVPCSESVASSIRPLLPPSTQLHVIPNGCDVGAIQARATKSADLPKFKGNHIPKRIVMVARLDEIKDQATLIKAFASLKNPFWQLHLVGDGPCRHQLESLAAQTGLDPTSIFLGRRLDIPEILGNTDLFAFSTTRSEGFGIALIEAMSVGLPLIASDVPACREVLDNGSVGQLVPCGDIQAWAQSLSEVMTNSDLYHRLSQQSLARAQTYNIRNIAKRWYQEIV